MIGSNLPISLYIRQIRRQAVGIIKMVLAACNGATVQLTSASRTIKGDVPDGTFT
jgi:hypothetical protein